VPREILGRDISLGDARPLTVASLARAIEGASADRAERPALAVDVVPLTADWASAALPLLVESFSLREPMSVALGGTESDIAPFAEALMRCCLTEPLSFVAVQRASGRVVGLCLAHDLAGPPLAFRAERDAPRLAPLFSLLAALHDRYAAARPVPRGRALEIAATAAAADVDGYAVALALERRALDNARAHGFGLAMTLCTSAVTRYIAQAEERMEVLHEVRYDSFVSDGVNVFAAAARHRGVALCEKSLP
jgi:hypothetical protein